MSTMYTHINTHLCRAHLAQQHAQRIQRRDYQLRYDRSSLKQQRTHLQTEFWTCSNPSISRSTEFVSFIMHFSARTIPIAQLHLRVHVQCLCTCCCTNGAVYTNVPHSGCLSYACILLSVGGFTQICLTISLLSIRLKDCLSSLSCQFDSTK